MKRPLLFTIFMAIALFGMAQTVVFSDNFDSYTAGSYLAQSNSAWTTWSNMPGTSQDGVISNTQAASTPNSLYISGSNDQVFPFGNYTTGHYTIAFNYYVPSSGNGAYFNVQHVLLQQWAFECYFYNTGSGSLSVNNTTYQFTYSCDTWFPVLVDIDMDNDIISLTINNALVQTWVFSSTTSDPGVNQLAGINFYAGSPISNQPGTYYVDDFVVTELNAALVGQFSASTEQLFTNLGPDESGTLNLTLSNDGTASTDYQIVTTYDIPNPDPTPTDTTFLHYVTVISSTTIGFTDGAQYDLAVGFPSAMIQPYIGKTLQKIYFLMPQGITNTKIRVYGMSHPLLSSGPGEMIYEQSYTPVNGWNYVTLDNPIVIDGSDLWVGIWIDQPAGVYPIAMDTLPANPYGAWFKSGSQWISTISGYEHNFAIGAWIEGTPITPWLTVNPEQGSLAAGASQNIAVTLNSDGMNEGEMHTAKLHCYSTSFDNSEVIVHVGLSINVVSVNDHDQIEISIYPNPSTEHINVTADFIQRVEIFNMAGQKVLDNTCNDSHVVIPTSNFTAGTYLVTVTINSGKTTRKVIIQ